jgi:hypothetical protein
MQIPIKDMKRIKPAQQDPAVIERPQVATFIVHVPMWSREGPSRWTVQLPGPGPNGLYDWEGILADAEKAFLGLNVNNT